MVLQKPKTSYFSALNCINVWPVTSCDNDNFVFDSRNAGKILGFSAGFLYKKE